MDQTSITCQEEQFWLHSLGLGHISLKLSIVPWCPRMQRHYDYSMLFCFTNAMLCISAVFAVESCLSVRLSRPSIVSKQLNLWSDW